jgi:hypothetical protein
VTIKSHIVNTAWLGWIRAQQVIKDWVLFSFAFPCLHQLHAKVAPRPNTRHLPTTSGWLCFLSKSEDLESTTPFSCFRQNKKLSFYLECLRKTLLLSYWHNWVRLTISTISQIMKVTTEADKSSCESCASLLELGVETTLTTPGPCWYGIGSQRMVKVITKIMGNELWGSRHNQCSLNFP